MSERPADDHALMATCFLDIADAVLHPPADAHEPFAPPDLERLGTVYTNFDHTLDEGIAARLTEGGCSAEHTAWDFHGTIWYADGVWFEEIRVYQVTREILRADSLRGVIEAAIEEYGSQ